MPRTALERIEDYYDAVPRLASRTEDHGPLALFVNRGAGFPYYARPRRGRQEPLEAGQVLAMRERQRALGVPESFEWVAEVTPDLAAAARAAGLRLHEHELLALDAEVVFLSAADEDVARIYRRLGLVRVATAMITEPPG